MTRANLQFAVGLALGYLTIFYLHDRKDLLGELLPQANIVAAAAATMIAPRLWWVGVIALWIGQSIAFFVLLNGHGLKGFETISVAFRYPYWFSSANVLLGAVLGGALWYIVDRRRKGTVPQGDCRPPL